MLMNQIENRKPLNLKLLRNFTDTTICNNGYTLYFILEGNVLMTYNSSQYVFQKNDLGVCNPKDFYTITALKTDCHILLMEISSSFIETYFKNREQLHFKECHLSSAMDNAVYISLCKEIAQIIYHFYHESNTASLHMISAISNIIAILTENFGEFISTSVQNTDVYTSERILYIQNYIEENYASKISLTDISKEVGLHPNYFSTFFRRNFDDTFINYVNHYRILKSIPDLLHNYSSITEIANNCGFNDCKIYSQLFRKYMNMTPSTFRKKYFSEFVFTDVMTLSSSLMEVNGNECFEFFQQFIYPEKKSEEVTQKFISNSSNLTEIKRPLLVNQQLKINYIGIAYNCLQSKTQELIRNAKKELQFDYLRIMDIFSDNLNVYSENAKGEPLYNWHYLDLIFDFLTSIRVKPIIEIGFTPKELSTDATIHKWPSNTSPPKSYKKWSDLVTNFIEHCIQRYSLQEVESWYFDFWENANLEVAESYWSGTKEDFFELYKVTYNAIKQCSPKISFGTPAFSTPGGLGWYRDFLGYCQKNGLFPDYVALHTYNYSDMVEYEKNTYSLKDMWTASELKFSYDKDLPLKTVLAIKDLCEQHHFHQLPLIVVSWNLSFFSHDLTRDTCFMAPYIIYTMLQLLPHCKGVSYWALYDTNFGLFLDNKLFNGHPSMIDLFDIKKPAYYALKLYRRLSEHIVEYDNYHILTKSADGFQLLLFNFKFYNDIFSKRPNLQQSYKSRKRYYETPEKIIYQHSIAIPSGSYKIRKTKLDEKHGSSYDTWLALGGDEVLDEESCNYIRNISVPHISVSTVEIAETLLIDTEIPEYGVILYEITKC